MHFVYILQSERDGDLYVGRTRDIKKRLREHERGSVASTKDRRPLTLVYCEICRHVRDAAHREMYLKTSWGKRYLKHRLEHDLG